METLKENYDINVTWHSFELRPENAPPISAEYKAKILAARPQFVQMAKAHYGLDIDNGPFGINSRPALVGAKFAEANGVGEVYHAALLRAYWSEAVDISDLDALADLAVGVGLDRQAFLGSLDDETLDGMVSADITLAHQNGINSVPTMVFANKYIVSGAQPYPQLRDIVSQVENALNTL